MPGDPLILISDVHVDAWETDLPHDHQCKRRKLLEFFDWVIHGSGARRLVINGDLIDVPQKNRQPILPAYLDIAQKLAEVVTAGITLGYVIGNHDSGLVGLDIELTQPAVRIEYPYLVVESGGRNILVEHGHLQDPWLWDYVRNLASVMLARKAGPMDPKFLRAAGLRAATAVTPEEASLQIHGLWHAGAHELDPRSDAAAAALAAIRSDLAEDYSDVLDEAADCMMLKRRAEARERVRALGPVSGRAGRLAAGGPPLTRGDLEQLVQAYYSGPHWRRVARERSAEVSRRRREPITGVVMGHTHWPDEFRWKRGRRECHYINAGSWRRDAADIVVIKDGEMRLYRRTWKDGWPKLP